MRGGRLGGGVMRCLLLLAALLLPLDAGAQTRPFGCVGAEQLEDDVFAIPFAKGVANPGEAARANLDAAAALAARDAKRNLCVLGHAALGEGAAASGLNLAARRARAVAQQLAARGTAPTRIRAEARRASFARGSVPAERSVTIVVMPAPGPRRPSE